MFGMSQFSLVDLEKSIESTQRVHDILRKVSLPSIHKTHLTTVLRDVSVCVTNMYLAKLRTTLISKSTLRVYMHKF